MILIEGMDGTGKTTLAREVAQRLHLEYVHERNTDQGFHRYVLLGLNVGPVVSDRFHLSEAVYPVVKQDGRLPMLRWQQHMVERVLLRHGTVLVYCQTDEDAQTETFATRGETFVSASDVPLMRALYTDVVKYTLLPTLVYDYRRWNLDDFVQRLLTVYEPLKTRASWFDGLGGIGHQHVGSVLLVGERHVRGLTPEDPVYAPFVEAKGSSLYLHQALQLSGRTDYHITNAVKFGHPGKDRAALLQEVELLRPSRVVALGLAAARVLREVNVQHEVVAHPSARRRFKYNEILHYARQLAGTNI